MKNILLGGLLMFLSYSGNAQGMKPVAYFNASYPVDASSVHLFKTIQIEDSVGNSYLKKARRQKTIGIVIMSAGGALTMVSLLAHLGANFTAPGDDSENRKFTAGAITGAGIFLGGVAFMVASKTNRKKAQTFGVSLEPQQIDGVANTFRFSRRYPSLSVKLHLK